jgi:hypothetical protein
VEQYPIPQFIEQEAKIAFFISFRQFFYLVGAGVACFFLYFIVPNKVIFYFLTVLIFIVSAALAFVRINGNPLLNTVLNSIGFSIGSKNYTWKKKESPYPFKPIKRTKIHKIEQGPVLQAQASQLKKIKTSVELHTKY